MAPDLMKRRRTLKVKTQELRSEEELALALHDDAGRFINALLEDYAGKIMAYLGKVSWDTLNEHELADAFQETMRDVWQRVGEADFDAERPLRMVFRIARNKGIDARRRKMGRRFGRDEAANETDITDLVIADMEGTELAQAVKVQSTEERRRFEEALPELLAELPERQRAAATAFLECYADIRQGEKWEQLAQAMGALTGEPITAEAARSALRAALKKLRSGLAQQGFEFVEGKLQ